MTAAAYAMLKFNLRVWPPSPLRRWGFQPSLAFVRAHGPRHLALGAALRTGRRGLQPLLQRVTVLRPIEGLLPLSLRALNADRRNHPAGRADVPSILHMCPTA